MAVAAQQCATLPHWPVTTWFVHQIGWQSGLSTDCRWITWHPKTTTTLTWCCIWPHITFAYYYEMLITLCLSFAVSSYTLYTWFMYIMHKKSLIRSIFALRRSTAVIDKCIWMCRSCIANHRYDTVFIISGKYIQIAWDVTYGKSGCHRNCSHHEIVS